MKNLLITTVTAIILVTIMGCSASSKMNNSGNTQSLNENFKVPENVQNVLDNSCLQCHGDDGKFKAKLKWNFEKMEDADNSKLISKLSKIEDMLTEGKMPPEKYVKKNPSHKLSKENKELLINWASSLAEDISKK